MEIIGTKLADVKIIKCGTRIDNRGGMSVSLDCEAFARAGIDFTCQQQRIYHMPNKQTFFGIHFQDNNYPQSKMIRCVSGRGIDYIIDLKKESPTYKQWISIEICGEDGISVYVPRGYGHAFLSLADNTKQLFSIDAYFHPQSAKRIRYDDPEIGLCFPVKPVTLSDADARAPYLKDINTDL